MIFLDDETAENRLSEERERELIKRAKKGGRKAQNDLVKANIKLISSIASKYKYSGLPHEDLMGYGTIGLIKAIKSFNLRKKNRLSTYATWLIRSEIMNAVEKHIKGKKGRRLTEREKQIEDPSPSPEEHLFGELTAYEISELLDELSETEEKVIRLRYGIKSYGPYSFAQIGRELNLTRERVRQIHNNAIEKMQMAYGGEEYRENAQPRELKRLKKIAKFQIDKTADFIEFMDKFDEKNEGDWFNNLRVLMDEWLFTKKWVIRWARELQYDRRVIKYILEQIDRKIPKGLIWKPYGINSAKSGDFKAWMQVQVACDQKAPQDVVKPWVDMLESQEITWKE